MPLPIILVGAVAALVGGYGVKKGFDARKGFDEAEDLNKEAQQIYDDAQKSLEAQRSRTQRHLEDLARQKYHLHQHGLKPFVAAFKKIKNVNYAELTDDFDIDIEVEILDIQETVANMGEVLTGTAAAIGSGAMAGLATYGSVSLLGTASTGTAIGGLSGAASKSATLAWLGGGAKAAGGLGMAGGTVVLGGIVVAPAVFVGGMMLAGKAEEAVAESLSNLQKAETAAEAIQTALGVVRAISRKANEARKVLHRLQTDYLDDALVELKQLVSVNEDYHTYNKKQRRQVARTATVATTAYLVAEAPLFDENSIITTEIRKALRKANKLLKTLNTI